MFFVDFLKSQDITGLHLTIMQPCLNPETLLAVAVNVIPGSTVTHVGVDGVALRNIKLEGSTFIWKELSHVSRNQGIGFFQHRFSYKDLYSFSAYFTHFALMLPFLGFYPLRNFSAGSSF